MNRRDQWAALGRKSLHGPSCDVAPLACPLVRSARLAANDTTSNPQSVSEFCELLRAGAMD